MFIWKFLGNKFEIFFVTWEALEVEVAQSIGWGEILVIHDGGHNEDDQQCDEKDRGCDGDCPFHQRALFTPSWVVQSWGGDGEDKRGCKLSLRAKVEEVADGKENYKAKGKEEVVAKEAGAKHHRSHSK